jgi:glyoxylase-like metal-dependent hydrolase (beta-lactamase superfamily II)
MIAVLMFAFATADELAPPPTVATLLDGMRTELGAAPKSPIRYQSQSMHWDPGQSLDGYGTEAMEYAALAITWVTYSGADQLRLDLSPLPKYPVQWKFSWTETIVDGSGFRKGRDAFGGSAKGVLTPTRSALRRKLHLMGSPELFLDEVLMEADLHSVWEEGQPALVGTWAGAPMTLILDLESKLPVRLRVLEDVAVFGDAWHEVSYKAWTEVDGLRTPSDLVWRMDGEVVQGEHRTDHRVLEDATFRVPSAAKKVTPNADDLHHGNHRARFYADFANKSFPKDAHTTEHPIKPLQLSENTWVLHGPLYSVLATDIGDQLVLVEAPYAPEKSEVTLAWLDEVWPGRKVGTVALSHGHFDHIGGVRSFIARGAVVMVPDRHADDVVDYAQRERTLFPDAQSQTSAVPNVQGLPIGKRILQGSEGRSLELHVVHCQHSREMVIAYLPHEKTLFVSDLHSPGIPPTRGPIGALAMGVINGSLPLAMDFFAEGAHDLSVAVDQLGLEVDTIIGGHSAWKTGDMRDVHALEKFHGR